ncbi:CHS5 [Candida oxycetoniae]|uniref:Chitin biosynthesis protein CHS5 n=1 Tax=Candida oxycetoniae TaxID=497107 RepID=A0AAI9SVB9_9ASCO|nr:CHS5 [Candida oxycetoniae]KAI3403617.2 CHS5 [Candida oxycetoniae]
MVEVSLTVGKLDASLALLLTKDHHLIEFPTILLPNGVKAGSIVKIKCDQDFESEKEESLHFQSIQDEIYQTFATHAPKAPNLKVKNITQTSCVLEWDPLELGTSSLRNLILFKDGKKLGSIPQPLTNKTSKLSGLPVDKMFKFQLRLDTSAGTFMSQEIEVNTHKMTNLSGITVCIGDLSPNDPFSRQDIEDALKNMGAKHPAQDQVKVDTTHYLCTRENKQNPEYIKANEMNIPIIRPEWLKACERERRIVGVRDFYVKECVLPDLFAKNYWADTTRVKKNEQSSVPEKAHNSTAVSDSGGEKETVSEKKDGKVGEETTAYNESVSENGNTTSGINEKSPVSDGIRSGESESTTTPGDVAGTDAARAGAAAVVQSADAIEPSQVSEEANVSKQNAIEVSKDLNKNTDSQVPESREGENLEPASTSDAVTQSSNDIQPEELEKTKVKSEEVKKDINDAFDTDSVKYHVDVINISTDTENHQKDIQEAFEKKDHSSENLNKEIVKGEEEEAAVNVAGEEIKEKVDVDVDVDDKEDDNNEDEPKEQSSQPESSSGKKKKNKKKKNNVKET